MLIAVTVSSRLFDAVHRQLLKSDLMGGLLLILLLIAAALICRCSRDDLHRLRLVNPMIMILLMEVQNLIMLARANSDLLLINARFLQDAVRVVMNTAKAVSTRASLRVQYKFSLRRNGFKMISCFKRRRRCETTLLLAAAGGDRVFSSTLFNDVLL